MPKPTPLLVILAAAVLPYFVGLGDSTIWDANEAFYAETAREMVESGDYINPSFNYQPRFNKPVLSYWAVAASYRLFGVSERSERLPIALAAAVLVATAFGLGRAAGSRDVARGAGAPGLVAAIALATTPRLVMFSRRIIIDVWVTMFMGLTLLFFVLAEVRPEKRRRYLMLMYMAAGLGVLTKGPVAVVLPALAFLIYLAAERRLADLRKMMIPAGVAIVAIIVLPWYLTLYVQHGWVHIKEFFIDENLMRYAQPVGAPRRGPWFYLPVLLTDLFPWSLLLPAALFATWQGVGGLFRSRIDAKQTPDPLDSGQRAQRILLIWIATIVLFFTFSRTKQDLYIFPAVPAEAALVGVVLARKWGQSPFSLRRSENGDSPHFLLWSLGVAGALTATLGLGLLVFVEMPGHYQLAGSVAVALIALAGGIAVATCAARNKLALTVSVLASTFVLLMWVFVLVTLPDFERYKPVAPLVEVIKQRAGPHARIGYYRFAFPSMAFYMRRQVFEHFDLESLQQTFASGEEVYCVMTDDDYRAVKDTLAVMTRVVARGPLFDVKTRALLEGTALPDIVLVSNRP